MLWENRWRPWPRNSNFPRATQKPIKPPIALEPASAQLPTIYVLFTSLLFINNFIGVFWLTCLASGRVSLLFYGEL
jgi:hypothetical protein